MRPTVTRFLVLGLGLPGWGQGSETEEDFVRELMVVLNTPVISATRTLQKADRAPATVTVVTQDQIRRRRYRSLADVFRDLPEFQVDLASDYDTYHAVTVRGVRGLQKVVILLDGIRITGPTNEPVPLLENFPVHFARQIEVLYGPASALYGADAFSGVVNIITLRPHERTAGDLGSAFGTDGQALGQVFLHHKLGAGTSLSLGGQAFYDEQPDLSTRFPVDFAGVASYRTGVFNTPFGFTLTPKAPTQPEFQAPLQANAFWARLESGGASLVFFHRYGKTPSNTANDPAYAIYNNDVFLGTALTTVNATVEGGSGAFDYTTQVTGQRYTLNPRSNYRNFFTGMEYGYEYAKSQTLRLDQQLGWRGAALNLTGGFSLEGQDTLVKSPDLATPVDEAGPVRGKILGTDLDADFYVIKSTVLGAFLQGIWAASPTFNLTIGARWDRDSRYGATFNPRVGLVWTPGDKATFKLLAGSAFLAPSPQDAFNHYGSFFPDGQGGYTSPFWHLPNPGLKPQKLRTGETSGRFRISDRTHLTATLFLTRLKDLFAQAPDAGNTNLYGGRFKGFPVDFIEVAINQGDQENRGGSLKLDHLRTFNSGLRLHFSSSLSYVDGDLDARGDGRKLELPNISPWICRLAADLDYGAWSLSTRFRSTARQRILDTEPQDPGKRRSLGGYSTLDLACSYRFALAEAFLRLDNALDGRYRNVSPQSNINAIEFVGTPQNGRRILAGATWRY